MKKEKQRYINQTGREKESRITTVAVNLRPGVKQNYYINRNENETGVTAITFRQKNNNAGAKRDQRFCIFRQYYFILMAQTVSVWNRRYT